MDFLRLPKAAERLAVHGATLGVFRSMKLGGRSELFKDFGSLVTVFVGGLCGMGAVENWRRLLVGSGQCQVGGW
ncbi:hypothetical protein ACNAW0_29395 [Micromonospora sp. SL1-18]|uniref:hypothetical protein n=1 Tax=Micromonospora sp. SL1-18 TaxID=3399128 RepID=UPI003A4DA5FA